MNSHDSTPDGGFTGTGLSYDTKGFSLVYLEIHTPYCLKGFSSFTEGDMQILDL